MPYRYTYVFRLLDFYFMFFGIQHPIFDLLARAGVFGCGTILPALETAFCNFYRYPIFWEFQFDFFFNLRGKTSFLVCGLKLYLIYC